jgi:hypothetical protein
MYHFNPKAPSSPSEIHLKADYHPLKKAWLAIYTLPSPAFKPIMMRSVNLDHFSTMMLPFSPLPVIPALSDFL